MIVFSFVFQSSLDDCLVPKPHPHTEWGCESSVDLYIQLCKVVLFFNKWQ